jgi:MFS family permease
VTSARTSPGKVLVASTIGLTCGVSTVATASFGPFVFPLSQAFGWERGDISFAMTIFNVCNIIMFPVAGWLIDRLGLRKVLIPSIIMFGVICVGLSFLSGRIWQFYAGYGVLAVAAIGTSSVPYARLIVPWFSARRGLALGVAFAGMGIGVAGFPLFVQTFIHFGSWRTAYAALGMLVTGAVLPFVIGWARYPEEQKIADPATRTEETAASPGLVFHDAIRSRSFILLMCTFGLLGILTGGIPTHLVPLLVERGVDAMHAAVLASTLGFSLIAGRVIAGYLLDRIFGPLVMIVIVSLAVIGLAMMLTGVTGQSTIVAITLIGFTIGADGDFLSYLISRYVGLRAFSRVYGLLLGAFAVGMSMGPAVMGYSANTTGNYQLGLWVVVVATALAIVPVLFLGPYPDDLRNSGRTSIPRPTSADAPATS